MTKADGQFMAAWINSSMIRTGVTIFCSTNTSMETMARGSEPVTRPAGPASLQKFLNFLDCWMQKQYWKVENELYLPHMSKTQQIKMKQPKYPSLYQINTRVWLTELTRNLGRLTTLDDIPDRTLDQIAEKGF